jgi:hypothetical protein
MDPHFGSVNSPVLVNSDADLYDKFHSIRAQIFGIARFPRHIGSERAGVLLIIGKLERRGGHSEPKNLPGLPRALPPESTLAARKTTVLGRTN